MAATGERVGEEEAKTDTNSNKRKLDVDEIQIAKQKAQEIAARLLSNAESKRSRFDESSDTASFSQAAPVSDVLQKPAGQMTTNTQVGAYPYSVQTGSQYGFQGSSKRIDIPNAKVGVIIGKGGETIKYLQVQSGARIHITKDSDADPYSQTRDVEINGTSEQISRAEQLIKDVIAETDAGGSGSTAGRGSNFISPGGDQFSMKIPNDKVAWVIGKGGETIKNIQSRSGARIQIIPLHLPPGDTSTERNVYINGTQEQIDSAKELVNDVVTGNRARNLSTVSSYPQQGYGPPGNWAQPPMQQPAHGYAQPGTYPSAPPPYYSNYPQQPASWDQSNPPPAHLPPQQNAGYNYYGQQAPTEAGSGQPDVNYAYSQPAPTTNISYDQSYSQQPQSYGQEAPVQGSQYDQSNQYRNPGYGPPAPSTPVDGTVPTQPYGTQPPPTYPGTYNQPQSVSPAGYGPPQTYTAQQGYDQTGYAQSGYGGQKPPQFLPPGQNAPPPSQPVYGQGGYPSQPAPTYVQGTNPSVYGQQQTHSQSQVYTEPLAYGSERNGDNNTTQAGYGSSPAVQESVHPQS